MGFMDDYGFEDWHKILISKGFRVVEEKDEYITYKRPRGEISFVKIEDPYEPGDMEGLEVNINVNGKRKKFSERGIPYKHSNVWADRIENYLKSIPNLKFAKVVHNDFGGVF